LDDDITIELANKSEAEQTILKEANHKLQEFIDRVFQLSQENLVLDGHVDTGFLLKSGDIQRGFGWAVITYAADYASYVEDGRDPGSMPPIEPLIKWARRKLGLSEKEAKKAAWAIAKAIEARGIDASQYLNKAVIKARREYEL
jgi:hypothetical protein